MVAVRKSTFSGMTVAEFLDWNGDGTDTRYELVNGEPRAMAPASITHGILQSTVARLIGNHLADRAPGCHVVTAPGVQPRVRSSHNMRIPDLGVTCTPDERGLRTLPDPVLLIEILSPSNEAETWENVWTYTTLPSVREILVLWTAGIGAELLRRQADGNWPESPLVIMADDVLTLDSIGYQAPLRALYAGTHLVGQPD
ncbi:Endonuclease, Uma2 family (restriction endonuclease fold) [Azospirillum oryzae]|uniref:Endonuclease, Uma2 family (Restriction endonuclease fold) n=1 Tax=Azospirillum oryzae TaxID=286727 RepID=A0A1X7GNT7_9PROT|nr:Uma2 family endonuclease [Azospirillum oryzae]SMF72358.1 Endonuclease, Uma2 family (restriction endonuclease fold) [Azospirillum oryzae]